MLFVISLDCTLYLRKSIRSTYVNFCTQTGAAVSEPNVTAMVNWPLYFTRENARCFCDRTVIAQTLCSVTEPVATNLQYSLSSRDWDVLSERFSLTPRIKTLVWGWYNTVMKLHFLTAFASARHQTLSCVRQVCPHSDISYCKVHFNIIVPAKPKIPKLRLQAIQSAANRLIKRHV
jgi:hypothetical protein